jgi:hypothetical protein
MEYSAKVSNSMTVNNKTGETKLNDIKVKVDGFSDPSLLEKAKKDYNTDKELKKSKPKYLELRDWPEETWHDIYYDMLRRLLKRRKRAYT